MCAMNAFKSIRERLGMTQAEIGKALGMTQGNVFFYESRGQEVKPSVATKLIELARERGLAISFDHVYGATELPPEGAPEVPAVPEEQGGEAKRAA
jgi:transcriptional regulator with XRE-family HTH domain